MQQLLSLHDNKCQKNTRRSRLIWGFCTVIVCYELNSTAQNMNEAATCHCITGKSVTLHSNDSVTASSCLNVNQIMQKRCSASAHSDEWWDTVKLKHVTRLHSFMDYTWRVNQQFISRYLAKRRNIRTVTAFRLAVSGTVRHVHIECHFNELTRTGFPHERVSHAPLEIPLTALTNISKNPWLNLKTIMKLII